ncbi:MAG: hypothetical protein ACKOYK_13910, partial [Cyanobium sp.]
MSSGSTAVIACRMRSWAKKSCSSLRKTDPSFGWALLQMPPANRDHPLGRKTGGQMRVLAAESTKKIIQNLYPITRDQVGIDA